MIKLTSAVITLVVGLVFAGGLPTHAVEEPMLAYEEPGEFMAEETSSPMIDDPSFQVEMDQPREFQEDSFMPAEQEPAQETEQEPSVEPDLENLMK